MKAGGKVSWELSPIAPEVHILQEVEAFLHGEYALAQIRPYTAADPPEY
jgi:hypothetical protein